MFQRRLKVIDSYEVVGHPVVGPVGLKYQPWLSVAVLPYRATQLPVGSPCGLAQAIARAQSAA